jgi:hypothetical protein
LPRSGPRQMARRLTKCKHRRVSAGQQAGGHIFWPLCVIKCVNCALTDRE